MNRKIIIFSLVIISILLFFSNCGKKIEGPAIRFKSTTFDFGEVAQGIEIDHSFTFKNPGTETLVIKNVKPTCGCTVAGDYDKEIEPGKSGKIPIVFRTIGYKNEIGKTIKVETNIPESEMIDLTIKGIVKVYFEIEPKNVWLGRFSSDKELTGSFQVKNHTDKPMKIMQVDPSNDSVRVSVNSEETDKIYKIDFVVPPPFKLGNTKEEILVKTNLKEQPSVNVSYNYYKMDLLEISPKEIILYPGYMRSSVSRIISIYNNTSKPASISDVIISGDGITYKIEEIIKGNEMRIILTFIKDFKFTSGKDYYISFKLNNVMSEPTYTVPITEGTIKK